MTNCSIRWLSLKPSKWPQNEGLERVEIRFGVRREMGLSNRSALNRPAAIQKVICYKTLCSAAARLDSVNASGLHAG
jgi:hypothetical protein